MSNSTHTPSGLAARDPSRQVFRQALGFIAGLMPAAMLSSYALASLAGAASPELAAFATALVGMMGAALILASVSDRQQFAHDRLGACNVITLARGAGIAVMAGLVLAPAAALGWALAGLAGLILLLDGLDGWFARREGLQSEFGARFDVESDVAFALTLAALAVALGHVGAWFLLLGLMRPIFLAAGVIWPALRAPLPEARWRKQIAGLQMGGQVALITPLAALPWAPVFAAAMLALVIGAFMVDAYGLMRRRAVP